MSDQPAQDVAAEQSVLGAMLVRPSVIPNVTTLISSTDYYRPAHETIHDVIVSLEAQGAPVDMVTVGTELQRQGELARIGGAPYLHTLADAVPVPGNAAAYATIVRGCARLRAIVEAGHKLQQLGGSASVDNVDETLAAALENLDGLVLPPGAGGRTQPDVEKQLKRMRATAQARQLFAAERANDVSLDGAYLSRADLLTMPAPDPLIEKVLPRHAYAILRGRDHSFKSFVAIDWALCLATGKPWQGHPVVRVPVLYIAGEGAHGLRARVDAWEYAWSTNVPPDMFTVRTTALNMHQPGPAFDHLLDHVTARGYGLVIVDTLRRVAGAADGNSSEMGLVIDNLDRLKHATVDGTVLTVAHTDKGDHDTRGYSGIEDDADVVWAAKREDMFLTLELTKMKDGPDGRTLALEATRSLGSLTLSGLTGPAEINTTESQLKILDTMRDLFPDGAAGGELLATSGLAKATFYRAVKDLLTAGQLVNTGPKRQKYYELPALPDTSDDTDQEPTP